MPPQPVEAEAETEPPLLATTTEPILALLIHLSKKGKPKGRFPIQKHITTMGRDMDNDVRFVKTEVSRLHCTIEIDQHEVSTLATQTQTQP